MGMRAGLFFASTCALTQLNSKAKEEYFKNNLKVEIYTKTWEPVDVKPVANLVFVHGFNDHINRYNHVFSNFAEEGIKVHAFDQVGCGQTGKRANNLGGAMGMERVKLDIDDAIDRIDDKKTPLFLMGHSFGGATIVDYLARGNKRSQVYGALAAAPSFELAAESQPSRITVEAVKGTAIITPSLKLYRITDPSSLSRNRTYIKEYANDPLNTSRWAAIQVRDAIVGGRYIMDGGYKTIKVPRLMIAHGSSDLVTNHATSEKLAETLKQQDPSTHVEYKLYPFAYHELHNDIIQEDVIDDYAIWILNQLNNTNRPTISTLLHTLPRKPPISNNTSL
ncbi:hypothetical protein DSO57_1014352 [Entomophthora muscae]|uniref:Uncharacterized protein n=1 Tax=Entomophthora muscae TaxID=34485 RepID=A0ACC2U3W0_9FUNG|nr:hypothetical protein DSO57_1014352 [Entomophthora muscae]